MNQKEIIQFLEKFNIDNSTINSFFNNKQIFEDQHKNIYLNKKPQTQDLLFIQLQKLLPSTYLLNFIKNNTENLVEVSGEKQALNFTYSKNLLLEQIKNSKEKFSKDKYYLILHENKILGIAEFVKEGKKFFFKNEINIGEYLKE